MEIKQFKNMSNDELIELYKLYDDFIKYLEAEMAKVGEKEWKNM